MIKKIFFLLGIFSTLSSFLLAQEYHVQPLEEKDIEVTYDNKVEYVPDAIIGGKADFGYHSARGELFRDDKSSYLEQEFQLSFDSIVNNHISVHLTLANQAYRVGTVPESLSKGSTEPKATSNQDTREMGLFFQEAYLEYNHNPSAVFRMGRQPVKVGDQLGMIYQGNLTGVTQTCAIGTWCYNIGATIWGEEEKDTLYWALLDYPVYETGHKIRDPWNPDQYRQARALNVELYRIFLNHYDSPLATYGGTTWRSTGDGLTSGTGDSPYQIVDPTNQKLVYFDNNAEYYGINVEWFVQGIELNAYYSQLNGIRKYHTGTQNLTSHESLGKTSNYGYAYNLGISYMNTQSCKFFFLDDGDQCKLGFNVFQASGEENQTAKKDLWDRDVLGFYEAVKGTYGDANLYFKGLHTPGQQHSINNLTYFKLYFSYLNQKGNLKVDTRLYSFYRTEPVLQSNGEQAADIGFEIDLDIHYLLDKQLSLDFNAGAFQTGAAYTPDDNLVPPTEREHYSGISLGLSYYF